MQSHYEKMRENIAEKVELNKIRSQGRMVEEQGQAMEEQGHTNQDLNNERDGWSFYVVG